MSERNEKRNLYKVSDIFRCVHDVHHDFKSKMSPFHILNQKKCFPNGCVYFKWKCKLLAKQKKCFRNFSHVGKECFNCRYFYEEKIHQYPEVLPESSDVFFDEYIEFEEWVKYLQQRRTQCEGSVSSVQPDLKLIEDNGRSRLLLKGFLVRFNEGYLNDDFFADSFYLSVSALTQNKLRFRSGDKVEFEATLTLDKGRFKFIKSGKLYFFERGRDRAINRSDALTNLDTAKIQDGQPLKCKQCQHGLLVDCDTNKNAPRRAMICTAGQKDFRECTSFTTVDNELVVDSCAALSCHHAL
jgi:hypothetical protein